MQAASHSLALQGSSPGELLFFRVEQPSSRSILLENPAGPTIIVNAAVEAYLDTKGE